MSRTRRFTSRKQQQGDAIVEALVGMALAALIAMSSVYALARGARVQNIDNFRAQVVDQLRAQIQAQGPALCGVTKVLSVGATTFSAVYTCTPYNMVSVTFPGTSEVSVTPATTAAQIITASVTNAQLGGTLTMSSN